MSSVAVLEKNVIDHESEMSVLLSALIAMKKGQHGVRMPVEWEGVAGKVADAFNEVIVINERMANELARLSRTVGKEGKLSQRLALPNVEGFWRDSTECVNDLIEDLVHPISETARVIGSVAQGNLSQTMALEIDDRPLQGEFLRTAKTINTMFASEVTRVAREVGTEGKLGGQAKVKGVAGTWKDLTDNVNLMASNLTGQVRNIAEVTTAVAGGDLSRRSPST
jgi:HAMP domain-containing protein